MSDNRIADGPATAGSHTCSLTSSDAHVRAVIGRFFREGLMADEHCIVVLDRADWSDTLAAIGTHSEIAQWLDDGQLDVRSAPLPNGQDLTPDEMLDVWSGAIEISRSRPVRIGGEASWWLHRTTEERLIHYESQLNDAISPALTVLCIYNLSRFSPDILLDVLRTHPAVFVGGNRLVESDYYLSPKDFLRIRPEHSVARTPPDTAQQILAILQYQANPN